MRWPLSILLLAGLSSPALSAPAEPAQTAEAGEKLICKKQRETGSLVKTRKTCHTAREWQRLRERNQEFGAELRDKQFSNCAAQPGQDLPQC